MSRELDVECARAMGYKVIYSEHTGKVMGVLDAAGESHNLEQYSTDHTAARLLEDEIDRRGLQEQYMIALLGEGGSYLLSLSVAWELLRATPEQKARAFLKACAS